MLVVTAPLYALLLASPSAADGNNDLGRTPVLAQGIDGLAAAGTGPRTQPGTIRIGNCAAGPGGGPASCIEVPAGAAVRQILMYVEGHGSVPLDDITPDTVAASTPVSVQATLEPVAATVTLERIGISQFFDRPGRGIRHVSSSYRADVTALLAPNGVLTVADIQVSLVGTPFPKSATALAWWFSTTDQACRPRWQSPTATMSPGSASTVTPKRIVAAARPSRSSPPSRRALLRGRRSPP